MENCIEIKNLCKYYNNVKAVDDISFRVKTGEFFAFLGINGAGKSTTISIMCGENQRTSGEVKIFGKDIDKQMDEIRNNLGIVYQNNVLDKSLSVYDNLMFRGSLYNMNSEELKTRINKLSEMFDFKDILNRTYGKLSGGQRRRVDIARALIHNPSLLVLDEPTTGLDPQTRKLVWNVLLSLKEKENLTIFLTTHYMEEVSEADYIVILNKGKITAEGTPLYLKDTYTKDYILVYHVSLEQIKTLNKPYKEIPNGFKIDVENTKEASEIITAHKDIFFDFEVIKGKMDDVFLNATGIHLGGE